MTDFILNQDEKHSYRLPLFWAIAAIATFVGWASLNEIDQHVRGYGRIIPAGEKKVIQHLEGGIIADIPIKEGQRVEKGDTIFVVRNQDAASERQEIRLRISAAQIRLKRLQAAYNGERSLSYTDDEEEKYAEMIRNERLLFNNDRQSSQEAIKILEQQKRQKNLRLDDLRTQRTNLQAERKTADDQFEINSKLKRAGAISQSRYLDSQSRVQGFNTRIAQIEKQIPVVQAEFAEADNRIREEKEKRKTALAEDTGKTNLEIRQLEERIKSSDDRVLRRAVLAPETGIINKVYMKTLGGVVKPGAPLADLVPLDAALVIEAEIATDDRGQIWPNLPVNVRVTAYDYTTFGSIPGTLRSISADSFKNDRGQEFYTVKIDLHIEESAQEKPLYPGMTTEVNILTGKQRVIDYLLKPIRRIGSNALKEE